MAQSTLEIEELDDDYKSLSAVQLIGPGLPFRGASWETQQRVKTTWYAGNSLQATRQIYGPIELPSQWEGEWRSIRMIQTPSLFFATGLQGPSEKVFRAYLLRDILDAIFYRGRLLRVTWFSESDTTSGLKIVRVGTAKTWKFPHDRVDDIKWNIEFEWSGRDAVNQSPVSLRLDNQVAPSDDLSSSLSGLSSLVDGFKSLENLAEAPLDLLNSVGNTINRVGAQIDQIGDVVNNIINIPNDISEKLRDIGDNTNAQMARFAQDFSSTSPSAYTKRGISRPTKTLNTMQHVLQIQTQAQKTQLLGLELLRAAKKQHSLLAAAGNSGNSTAASILGTYVVKQGDTFASISILFYSTPDNSYALAKANGFPAYQISPAPGQVLIIPIIDNSLQAPRNV